MRDEYRTDFDAGRGGYGNIVKTELMTRQQEMEQRMNEYAEGQEETGDMDAYPTPMPEGQHQSDMNVDENEDA